MKSFQVFTPSPLMGEGGGEEQAKSLDHRCVKQQKRYSVANWVNIVTLPSHSFVCGHCDHYIASHQGYYYSDKFGYIYLCHHCHKPTFFDDALSGESQSPSPAFGELVKYLPEQIEKLYNEARNSIRANAHTGSILCCRKLLMHIAVSKGATEGLKFIEYVDFLSEKGFVPPDGKEWVDHIRTKGNEATHEIVIMSRSDAEELVSFIEMLLKIIYEFPAIIKNKKK